MKRYAFFAACILVLGSTLSAQTIADVAIGANGPGGPFEGQLDTLLAAVTCTGLVGPLATAKKQYTVFAPTDDAFNNLGLNETNICGAFNVETLTAILQYHVAPGRRYAVDVIDGENVRTLSKSFIYPYVDGGNAFIRDNSAITFDAQIIALDIEASNGVIHAIDQVLLP